jgi:hypothetical protein
VRATQNRTVRVLLVALSAFLGATSASASVDELVKQFIESCIGTLPDFSGLGQSLSATEFKQTSKRAWIREADGAVFMIQETSDRLVCMGGVIGDVSTQLSKAIAEALNGGKLGRYEEKSYEGRQLFLLQAERGLTILEVVPPIGATTYLLANSLKE